MAGRWRRAKALHWLTPRRFAPHGAAGLVATASGAVLVRAALRGEAHLPNGEPAVPALARVYLLSTLVNAAAGWALSGLAPRLVARLFRVAAVLQACLAYFALRFLELPSLDAKPLRGLDALCAVSIVASLALMTHGAFASVREMFGSAVAWPIVAGCGGLALLSGYPVQLALQGEEWYACVLGRWPLQRVGFVFYVYVPATFCFGTMLFGATLVNRRVIDGNALFGAFFVGLILATLVSTVLMQEVHIPYVSTQQLVINCPAAAPGTWQHTLATSLDTSRLAQSVLGAMGVPLPPPPTLQ